MRKVFPDELLFDTSPQRWYEASCSEAAFLIGGIGTGNFSIGARGELRDWELFGTPAKGNILPNTFFAIRVSSPVHQPVARVLESQIRPPFRRSHGFVDYEVGGLPRFRHSRLKAEYPFVTVELSDPSLPVAVTLEAFNPFIPLNADDSGIPTGVLRYRVKNLTGFSLSVSVAGSLCNFSAFKGYERHTWKAIQMADEVVNEYRDDGLIRGLFFRPKNLQPGHRYYGTMALTTRDSSVSHKRAWLNGGWWDGLQDFWDDFRQDGWLESESHYIQEDAPATFPDKIGSLAIHHEVPPHEEATFEFQITWHFPHRVNSWSLQMYREARARGEKVAACTCVGENCSADEIPTIWQYYATRFTDAWHAAHYTMANLERLEGTSRLFRDAFFSSTLPSYVLDAVASNITVLRSPTCFRLEDGTLMAWEGCFDDEGCCEGNCTHVLNYAQTIAYLFPELERSMRRVEFAVETEPSGKMNFRSYKLFGMEGQKHMPAADGQLGTIIRLYREWKLSGNDNFLRLLWEPACKALDFAFEVWDQDGDLVLDTDLFNTYDIAFQGPTSMINSLFYAALLAGTEMATYLGQPERAARYRAAFEEGSRRMDTLLWGGDYYIQKIEDANRFRYQYGTGCLADQLFGQMLSHLAGLGYVLPEEHVKRAVRAIFEHNFATDLSEHHNTQRTYALNDEKGLLLCTWPAGGRPRLPFPYSDEVWSGIEYQVATHLIYEGYLREGLTLVKAVRDRYDGIKRNPWNEIECGHHYMRSLASYGVLVALSGFRCDLPRRKISFAPRIFADHFRCFFSTGTGWGVYTRHLKPEGQIEEQVEVLYGSLDGVRLESTEV